MNVDFSIQGQRQLQARLDALGKAPRTMLQEVGLRAVREAKLTVPRRTGNLGRTIRVGSLSGTAVEVKAGGQLNVGYAAAVEFGTKAHVIRPRRARVLAWGGPRTLAGGLRAGGRPTNFAMSVNHPGTRAKPYLIPGFEKALKIVGLDGFVKRWNGAA